MKKIAAPGIFKDITVDDETTVGGVLEVVPKTSLPDIVTIDNLEEAISLFDREWHKLSQAVELTFDFDLNRETPVLKSSSGHLVVTATWGIPIAGNEEQKPKLMQALKKLGYK